MSHSPAEVLRASLVGAGLGVLRSKNPNAAWPVYVGHMPATPDNVVCVYDTAGRREGRLMGTGESQSKPGWQVRVRGRTHPVAIARMNLIKAHLDSILREAVRVGEVAYVIQAVTQTTTVLPLGQEPEGERRVHFTLNGTITYRSST